MDNIDLEFDNEVLDYIVDKALEYKLGARGLRSICEIIMMDVMFEMNSEEDNKLRITFDYARQKLESDEARRLRVA